MLAVRGHVPSSAVELGRSVGGGVRTRARIIVVFIRRRDRLS
jgi:hypothetical protein